MESGLFRRFAIFPENRNWNNCNQRAVDLYQRKDEIRSEFERDYNRILHCTAYRRLKHKTQVFYATRNDHICTRIEHVNHVTSVSYTISKYLGLNTELTKAIAIGHDLGHAPFGHSGERIINEIALKENNTGFWHEKNGLRIVDSIELLEDEEGNLKNLDLTYAVRDGIVSHCGEVNENAIFPRTDNFDLHKISTPNEFQPYTWEACVVKIADKISYLGRDIEDASNLNILKNIQIDELRQIVGEDFRKINNTILMHKFITDLCANSSPGIGICLSDDLLRMINDIKAYNYKNIYKHPRLINYFKYAEMVISSIFYALAELFDHERTIARLKLEEKSFPLLSKSFCGWLQKYSLQSDENNKEVGSRKFLYDLKKDEHYKLAIIDYISSLTDFAAINVFNELTSF
jgi:dGTPase